MHLVQLLIPLYDNQGRPFARPMFDRVRHELTEAFGGVTVYVRSPAHGFWKDTDTEVVRDDVVMFEVMAGDIDGRWWASYRQELEQRFGQQELVIRHWPIDRL